MKKSFVALASTVLISAAFAQVAVAADTAPAVAATTATAATAAKHDAKRDAANEKHIKDLHAKLKITADEETLWATVAGTMRSNTIAIDTAVDKREELLASATAIDDLNAYAGIAQAHADSVKKLSVSFAPLYAAMPDAQKKIADTVFTQRASKHKS
ncbi:protein CpxP [Oxalobacteraceae bacterium GrIS 2.11]